MYWVFYDELNVVFFFKCDRFVNKFSDLNKLLLLNIIEWW